MQNLVRWFDFFRKTHIILQILMNETGDMLGKHCCVFYGLDSMSPEIISLIGEIPYLPGPLERSFTVCAGSVWIFLTERFRSDSLILPHAILIQVDEIFVIDNFVCFVCFYERFHKPLDCLYRSQSELAFLLLRSRFFHSLLPLPFLPLPMIMLYLSKNSVLLLKYACETSCVMRFATDLWSLYIRCLSKPLDSIPRPSNIDVSQMS